METLGLWLTGFTADAIGPANGISTNDLLLVAGVCGVVGAVLVFLDRRTSLIVVNQSAPIRADVTMVKADVGRIEERTKETDAEIRRQGIVLADIAARLGLDRDTDWPHDTRADDGHRRRWSDQERRDRNRD